MSTSDYLPDEALVDQAQSVQSEDNGFAVFGGDELKVEKRRSDAHKGTILAVTRFDSPNTGSPAVQVLLQSDDTGSQDNWTIFVPKPFAQDTGAFVRGEKGIEDLSAGYPDPERPGKIKGNERNMYGMAYKNSAGDASIQQLLAVASKSGRRPEPGTKIETFDDFIEVLNALLNDVKVVYTRRASATEDNPRGFLNVNRVYFPGDVLEEDGTTKPKALKNYLRRWEVDENFAG